MGLHGLLQGQLYHYHHDYFVKGKGRQLDQTLLRPEHLLEKYLFLTKFSLEFFQKE
jgi:hypothetical protein